MRLLLDTQVFIWAVTDDKRLTAKARKTMREATHIYVSAASIWEIAIKSRLGKLDGEPGLFVQAVEESGFDPLPVSLSHAAAVHALPLHHHDPFDRLLVAQAVTEPLILLTADRLLLHYSELVQIV
jgi:PIN domain nuclease of toxin-antitoxin system